MNKKTILLFLLFVLFRFTDSEARLSISWQRTQHIEQFKSIFFDGSILTERYFYQQVPVNKCGIQYDFSKTFAAEIRFELGKSLIHYYENELNLLLKWRLKGCEDYAIYLGAGAGYFDESPSVFMPLSLEWMPLKQFRRLSLNLELEPRYFNDDVYMYGNWGLRYRF